MIRSIVAPVAALLLLPVSPVHRAAAVSAQQAADADGMIEIEEPASWAPGARGLLVHTSGSLRVTGRVSHPGGVQRVVVNDRPFFLVGLADGSARFDGYVPIAEGTDSVHVVAVTSSGATFSESYPVQAELPSAEASDSELWNSALSGFKGERWAVVVGISEYQHPDIPDLEFADRDAEQFAQFLVSDRAGLGGFDPEKVLLLKNEEATYRRLRNALFSFLKNPTEDDVVYVFWAGHGTPDRDRLNDLYLLPYDAEPNDVASTAIPMEDLQDALGRTLARDKIIITDACHSAGVGFSGTRALQGLNQINSAFLERLAMGSGGAVSVTSSRATEISREGRQWGGGHGVFSYHLLQGLQGKADVNGDRIVDLEEMFEYVRERVRRDTQNAQTPTMSQSPFNTAWPMSAVLEGEALPSVEELSSQPVSTVSGAMMMDLIDGVWSVPDSLNAFIGVHDTIHIRLNGRSGPKVDGSMLTWGSSNAQVAGVTQDGVLRPLAPGMTTVSARYFSEKRMELAVRVYDRPLQIEFSPRRDTLSVVRGDQVRLSAAMELPSGEIVRGVLPSFEIADSLVVAISRNESDQLIEGQFRALREGTATVVGTLAGVRHEWLFEVQPPGLQIVNVPPVLLTGESLEVEARHTRSDGTLLMEALGVAWESTDSTVIDVRLGGITAQRPGRTLLIASTGTVRDTVQVSVLGDLILSTERDGKSRIDTYSVERDEFFPLLDDEYGGDQPTLSPDGSEIAFLAKREDDSAERIYVMDSDGTRIRRLVQEKDVGFFGLGRYYEAGPAWSHDGSVVYFSSNRDGNYDIYSISPDGDMDQLVRISEDGAVERAVIASSDGPNIAFERVVDAQDSDVIVALGDGAEALNITAERTVQGRKRSVREARPTFVPERGGLLLIEQRGDEGEALVGFDVVSRQRTAQLVEPQKGHEIVYAISPRGDRIVYHQRPHRGSSDGRVVIADLDGTALHTFSLPPDRRLTSLSWGAVPIGSN